MKQEPIWNEARIPKFEPLSSTQRFDVVVVGGGITGLTAAYLLKTAGRRVCVLERDEVAAGDTGYTTAHLTAVTDLPLTELVRKFGRDEARKVWNGGASAINTIERITALEEIRCEFQRIPGYLHASLVEEKDERGEFQEMARLAIEFGFEARYVEEVPSIRRPGVRFADQAKFQPRAYLAALAQLVNCDGSAVYTHSEVDSIESDPPSVVVDEHRISCDHVIVATHVPIVGKSGFISATLLQTKLYPYSSYVVAADIPHGTIPEATYWDTSNPYYYLRVDRRDAHDRIIFGGADHKTGQQSDTDKCYADVEQVLKRICPGARLTNRWSGQVIDTNDNLPYIGEMASKQFLATGFGGNGMTFGTLAGTMACDWVLGKENAWQGLFSVGRTRPLASAAKFLKENIDYPYYLVSDRFRTEPKTTRGVKRGEGRVLKLDGKHVACYRDDEGELTKVSAVCTHMGCLVRFNSAEKTWDCPCHGSRFHKDGSVMAGPAESPLEPIGKPTRARSKS